MGRGFTRAERRRKEKAMVEEKKESEQTEHGKVEFEISIKMFTDGYILTDAPMYDKVTCYGLLEVAKQTIQKWQRKPTGPLLYVPSSAVVPGRS